MRGGLDPDRNHDKNDTTCVRCSVSATDARSPSHGDVQLPVTLWSDFASWSRLRYRETRAVVCDEFGLTMNRANLRAADTSIQGKLVQLEALRGVAAFIVVAWHFLWAFDPARIGIVDGFDPSTALLGSVGFASIDGPAAVTLFFVLSGFVLPLGFFRSGRTEIVVRATAKRWLRLVCLVMLAVLLSWLLFRCGPYRHREAAQLSGSAWLGTFGGSHPNGFTPSFGGAALEGLLFAFLREPDMYDPVLWTMHHEFIGSFVTFYLAVMLWRARRAVAIWLLASAAVVVHFTDPYLIAFVAGTGLAWLVTRFDVHLSSAVARPASPAASSCSATSSRRGATVHFRYCATPVRRASTGSPCIRSAAC